MGLCRCPWCRLFPASSPDTGQVRLGRVDPTGSGCDSRALVLTPGHLIGDVACGGRRQILYWCRPNPNRYRRDRPVRREVGRFERTRLPEEDVGQPPSADARSANRTWRTRTAFRGRTAGRRPWWYSSGCGGCRRHCRSHMAVEDRSGAVAAAFSGEAAIIRRSLIIGQRLGEGIGGVEFQPLLEAVAELCLQRVVARVCARGARVDAAPVGKQPRR